MQNQSSHSAKAAPSGGYSGELERWLRTNAVMMGERSNFGGLKAAIERGGSGGNSGTKGVGVTRLEPFTQCRCDPDDPSDKGCPVCSFKLVTKRFDDSDKCWRAWRMLTDYERALLAARYLCQLNQMPPGLIGQLGDIAAVGLVVAHKLTIAGRFIQDLAKGRVRLWEPVINASLSEAHRSWFAARAEIDTDDDSLVLTREEAEMVRQDADASRAIRSEQLAAETRAGEFREVKSEVGYTSQSNDRDTLAAGGAP
jgi:hypothetical protein